MRSYIVLRNPANRHTAAIPIDYSVAAFLTTLICLGWIWGFANGAKRLAWRLLATSLLLIFLTSLELPWLGLLAAFTWFHFSVFIGSIANERVCAEHKRLGFEVIADRVQASNSEQAIDQALKH